MYEQDKEEQELINRILDRLGMVGDKSAKEELRAVLEVYRIVKTTSIQYCQSCGKDFSKEELVYFALIDNNIVCQKCGEVHYQKYLRVVK